MTIDSHRSSNLAGRILSSRVGTRLLAAARSFNLASLSLVRNPQAMKRFLGEVDMLHATSYARNPPLEPVPLDELLKFNEPIGISVPLRSVKPGSTPLSDLCVLAAIARTTRPKRVFEIGTFEGLTAAVFALNTESDAHVFTLDLPPEDATVPRTARAQQAQSVADPYESGRLIRLFRCNEKVTCLKGDSALFDMQPYRGSISLFFVDGAHTTDYVINDSLVAFRSITDEGWVLWHDCFTPQVLIVLRRISEYHAVRWITGTTLAVATGKPGTQFPWHILDHSIR